MLNRHMIAMLIGTLLLTLLVAACATVPLTGRRQVNFMPDSQMNAMSFQQYDQVIAESRLSSNSADAAMIERVGRRIQAAVERYLAQNGLAGELEAYQWEFKLIESDQVNAWCMPGGKVAFYTGILPVCQDETGVAVVMGHEVAHAIAKHGAERMTHGMMTQFGAVAVSEIIKNKPAQTQAIYNTAFALGAQYGAVLPFSRKHESEADQMGLTFMAMAGYDPREAPIFWERMASMGGQKPPEFLSTHPADETRVRQLNGWMPEALQHYQGN